MSPTLTATDPPAPTVPPTPATPVAGPAIPPSPDATSPVNPERIPGDRSLDSARVELAKQQFLQAFSDLDPRKYMRANPGTTVAASAVAGILAGLATRSDSQSLARSIRFATELASPLVAQIAEGFNKAAKGTGEPER